MQGSHFSSLKIFQLLNPRFLQGFWNGFCRYNGNLLENFEQIMDASKCQSACDLYDGCEYFVFEDYGIPTKNDCQLLNSKDKTCDLFVGLTELDLADEANAQCKPS